MILCHCYGINTSGFLSQLPNLNPCLPLADLGEKIGAGADCGACIKTYRKQLKVAHAQDSNLLTAKIHSANRQSVLFASFDEVLINAAKQTSTEQGANNQSLVGNQAESFYTIANLPGGLETAQDILPFIEGAKLFAITTDNGKKLFVNDTLLETSLWLATLDESKEFSPWKKINQGSHRRWKPKKIDEQMLLKFLISEITFVRKAMDLPELQRVVTISSRNDVMSQWADKISRLPVFKIFFSDPKSKS